MAKAELGVKRNCTSCAVRFYDLTKSPAICPKCGATVETAATIKAKRNKAAESKPMPDEDVTGDTDGFVDSVLEIDDDDDTDTAVVPQKASQAEDESEETIPNNFVDDPLIDEDEDDLDENDDSVRVS